MGEITSFEDFCAVEEIYVKQLDKWERQFDKVECGTQAWVTYIEYSYEQAKWNSYEVFSGETEIHTTYSVHAYLKVEPWVKDYYQIEVFDNTNCSG